MGKLSNLSPSKGVQEASDKLAGTNLADKDGNSAGPSTGAKGGANQSTNGRKAGKDKKAGKDGKKKLPPGANAGKTKAQKNAEKRKRQRQRRKLQGPLHPFALKVFMEENKALSLEYWRHLVSEASIMMTLMLEEEIAASTSKNKLKEALRLSTIDEWKFIEHPRPGEPQGTKTKDRPPAERLGHGLVLSFTKRGKELADAAFRRCNTDPETNEVNIYLDSPEVDVRGVFSIAVPAYVWPAMAKDNAIWRIIAAMYDEIPQSETYPEIVSQKSANGQLDLTIVGLRVDKAWEKAILKLNKVIKTPLGTIKFKRRRVGGRQPVSEASPAETDEDEEEDDFSSADGDK